MLAEFDEQGQRGASIRLLAAATEEFARHGFASARIRTIAVAARVNPAAANYYFGGKKGLYRATLKHLAGRLEPLDPVALANGCPPEERMRRCVAAMLHRFTGNPHAVPLARILAHEALAPSGNLEAVLDEALAPELSLLRFAIGDVAPLGIDAEQLRGAARAILAQCVLCLFAGSSMAGGETAFAIDDEACQLLATQISGLAQGSLKRLGYGCKGNK
jgi:AcrR family transcriptional regulator